MTEGNVHITASAGSRAQESHAKGLTCYILQQVVDVLIALCVIWKACGGLTEATGQSPLHLG